VLELIHRKFIRGFAYLLVNHKLEGYASPKEDEVTKRPKRLKSELNWEIKFKVELDELYWKNSQGYNIWWEDWMEITPCEYSQPNAPQDWTRRREELWIVKSV